MRFLSTRAARRVRRHPPTCPVEYDRLVATMGHIKGSLLVHLREQVVRRVDEQAWDRLVRAASPSDRELLGGVLLTGSWYPMGVWNRALHAFLAHHAPGNARDEAT